MVGHDFPALAVARKDGAERLHDGPQPLPFDLLNFWRWSASDLASNALRGLVAEFLVAQALGVADGIRAEWDAYDLRSPCGTTVEVKSAAYLQTWAQKQHSMIRFNIKPTRFWDPLSNVLSLESRRQADLYVFALLTHRHKATFDPADVSQWEFMVLGTETLNGKFPVQQTIGLKALRELGPVVCPYGGLRAAIESVARVRAPSAGGDLA